MVTKVQKWGNSQGLRLSKQVLDMARIAVGDEVEVLVDEHQIVLRKTRRKKPYDLQELAARTPKDYRGSEGAFGRPAGKEVW